jgi:hypothetical protein
MRLQHVVMHVTALEQFAQHMAHLLANTEQAYRTALGSFDTAHGLAPPLDGEGLGRTDESGKDGVLH